jgi:ABC-type phosphate transport system substrate-binding protein
LKHNNKESLKFAFQNKKIRTMKNLIAILVIILPLLLTSKISAQKTYVIIVNKSNPLFSLTQKEVSDLFLKKTKWKDGSAATPVDLVSNSKIREQFTQEIHGKSISAIRSFWQQAAFSGTASAPPEKSADSEIVDFVQKNNGAIGYVSASANTAGVKIISIQ